MMHTERVRAISPSMQELLQHVLCLHLLEGGHGPVGDLVRIHGDQAVASVEVVAHTAHLVAGLVVRQSARQEVASTV